MKNILQHHLIIFKFYFYKEALKPKNWGGKKRVKCDSKKGKKRAITPNRSRQRMGGARSLSQPRLCVYLPALPPLCFLQAATLPWLPLLPALTFGPCCRARAAACLPALPPSAAAVTAFCSREVLNEWPTWETD